MSYYKYDDFKKACGEKPKDVVPINEVLSDASKDFNLNSKSQLLDFIYNDGLECLTFINTKDWERNKDTSNKLKVDAYEFKTMYKLGYIAFMYNPKTKKWIIKSFHLSENRDLTMCIALEKAGIRKREIGDEK